MGACGGFTVSRKMLYRWRDRTRLETLVSRLDRSDSPQLAMSKRDLNSADGGGQIESRDLDR
jgi:hypothetical protein